MHRSMNAPNPVDNNHVDLRCYLLWVVDTLQEDNLTEWWSRPPAPSTCILLINARPFWASHMWLSPSPLTSQQFMNLWRIIMCAVEHQVRVPLSKVLISHGYWKCPTDRPSTWRTRSRRNNHTSDKRLKSEGEGLGYDPGLRPRHCTKYQSCAMSPRQVAESSSTSITLMPLKNETPDKVRNQTKMSMGADWCDLLNDKGEI